MFRRSLRTQWATLVVATISLLLVFAGSPVEAQKLQLDCLPWDCPLEPPPPPPVCQVTFGGWSISKEFYAAAYGYVAWRVYGNAFGGSSCSETTNIVAKMTVEPYPGGSAGSRTSACSNATSCHVFTGDNLWFNQPHNYAVEGEQVCFAGELVGGQWGTTDQPSQTSIACYTP